MIKKKKDPKGVTKGSEKAGEGVHEKTLMHIAFSSLVLARYSVGNMDINSYPRPKMNEHVKVDK